jgi:hypothetical protein
MHVDSFSDVVSTAAPMPGTIAKEEAIKKYGAFLSAGSLPFMFGMDVNGKNEPPSPHYYMLLEAKPSTLIVN